MMEKGESEVKKEKQVLYTRVLFVGIPLFTSQSLRMRPSISALAEGLG